ncbi:hypothetical protein DN069_19415 [Streptacidiphilus pinicola]|uniref:Uncharacterized protein n=1 Tax=Streptacidiphilus pinicola TaxID=2219663 RepID=A0A2X0IKP4_9ACTN|nr:hypothetical protein DN069_19415 [Streptacidiphilus pinicola]
MLLWTAGTRVRARRLAAWRYGSAEVAPVAAAPRSARTASVRRSTFFTRPSTIHRPWWSSTCTTSEEGSRP